MSDRDMERFKVTKAEKFYESATDDDGDGKTATSSLLEMTDLNGAHFDERTLLKVLQNEDKMDEYLRLLRDKPSTIDPVIWQVHFSVPTKKRMKVLDHFIEQLSKKYRMLYSFLPEHMIVAKVYKFLNIPYSVLPSKPSLSVDVIIRKKIPRSNRFSKYMKVYNACPKTEKNSDLGIYEFFEERPGPFVPYTEFRNECKKNVGIELEAEDVLNRLFKVECKKKIRSKFAPSKEQFLGKSTNQRNSLKPKLGLLFNLGLPKTQMVLSPQNEFEQNEKVLLISSNNATSGNRPRHPDLNSCPSKQNSFNLIEKNVSDLPESQKLGLFQEENPLVCSSRSNIFKNCEPPPYHDHCENRIEIEKFGNETKLFPEVVVNQEILFDKAHSPIAEKSIGIEKLDLSRNPESMNLQMDSEEPISLVKSSGGVSLNSSECGIVYSSSCSRNCVTAFSEFCVRDSISPKVMAVDEQLTVDKMNIYSFADDSCKETEHELSTSNNSLVGSNSSCGIAESNQNEVNVDFIERYSNHLVNCVPLNVEIKKKTANPAENVDEILESNVTSRNLIEIDQNQKNNRKFDADNEVNKISDSETSDVIMSTMPVSFEESVIITQRSNESESPERNLSPAAFQMDAPYDEVDQYSNISTQPTRKNEHSVREIPIIPCETSTEYKDNSPISKEARRKSRNKNENSIKKAKKLTDFVAFKIRKRCTSTFEQNEDDRIEQNNSESDLSSSCESIGIQKSITSKSRTESGHKTRNVRKLFNEMKESPISALANENASLTSPADKLSTSSSELSQTNVPDSDSCGSFLSQEFKTLSLTSKGSTVLFPSPSSKPSPSPIPITFLAGIGSNCSVSSRTNEITLDQIENMMKDIPAAEDGKEKLIYSNYNKEFSSPGYPIDEISENKDFSNEILTPNFNENFPLSHLVMEKSTTTNNIKNNYSTSKFEQNEFSVPSYSNKHTKTEISKSASHMDHSSFSFSMNDQELSTHNFLEEANVPRKTTPYSRSDVTTAGTKKNIRFSSRHFNNLPHSGRQCFSLPIENESSSEKKNRKRSQKCYNSDDDIFRDTPRSLPIQSKKKSPIQLPGRIRLAPSTQRSEFCDKENQIHGGKMQKKKPTCDSRKNSSLLSERVSNSFNWKFKSPNSLTSNKFTFFSDDDYESDELNSALNDSLTQFNQLKESEDLINEDAESTVSHHYDDEIAQLLNEYAALNAEQQPLSNSSELSSSASTSFMSTLKIVKSNSQSESQCSTRHVDEKLSSTASNYRDIMWNSYPDSLETALTTPEEKLDEVRSNLREKLVNAASQQSFTAAGKLSSSRENDGDSFSILDWD